MKKTILTILTIVAVISMAAPLLYAENAGLTMAEMEGKVMVKAYPQTEWTEAKVGQALNKNDAVKTGDDGKAILAFSDKSIVALKPGTEITVEELVLTNIERKVGLNMSSGKLRAIIEKVDTPSEFKVRTPTAICGARGTTFYIVIEVNETRVFVDEGAVDFMNAVSGNTYVVVQGMESFASINGTLTEPKELTGDEKDKVIAGWQVGAVAEPYTEPGGGETADDVVAPEVSQEGAASRV